MAIMIQRREQFVKSCDRECREGTLHVLIADDHKILRDGLAAFLGHEADIDVIGEADNGQDAVQLAQQLMPDVVLMDISMPVMDGFEATRLIKQQMPKVRIIVLSMFERASMAARAKEAGAEAFLSKGGSTEDLLSAIRGR